MLQSIIKFFVNNNWIEMPFNIKRQKYIVDFTVSTNSSDSQLTVVPNVSSLTFYNRGTTSVMLNNIYQLDPGEFLLIPCEWNEEDATRYFWSFLPTTLPTPVNKFVVVRKTFQ